MSEAEDQIKKIANLRQKFETNARNTIRQSIKSIFDDFPFVNKIAWEQYAPYFNDGDPCIFSVYEFYLNGISAYGDCNDFDGDEDRIDEELKQLEPAFNRLSFILEAYGDDVFEEAFGDDVLVTILRGEDFVIDDTLHS